MANERSLKSFLTRLGVPYDEIDDTLHALFYYFKRGSDMGIKCIDYSILNQVYLQYVNLKAYND